MERFIVQLCYTVQQFSAIFQFSLSSVQTKQTCSGFVNAEVDTGQTGYNYITMHREGDEQNNYISYVFCGQTSYYLSQNENEG